MNLDDYKKIKLPDHSGVYTFKKNKDILYIGKATSLKDRVRSYFSNEVIKTRGSRIVDMVTNSTSVEYIQADSVLEALILESNLIKKHKPKYNILEKDNKSYNFVVISNEDFPIIKTERGRTLDFELSLNKKYKYVFGPYPHGGQLKEALKIIRRIFPFRSGKQLSSIYREIGLEPNIDNEKAKKEYQKTINNIRLFFQGEKKEVEKSLKREMKAYAKAQRFELAEKKKRQLFALGHIKDVSLLKHEQINTDLKKVRIEAYDIAHQSGENTVGVMTVIEDDEPQKSEYRKFIIKNAKKSDDVGALKELLERRFKHGEWQNPDIVVIDGGIAQRNVTEKVFKEMKIKASIINIVKDDRHKPKSFIGREDLVKQYKNLFILINSEAHRFAISFFRNKQRKGLI